jgi:hypothetical protein
MLFRPIQGHFMMVRALSQVPYGGQRDALE